MGAAKTMAARADPRIRGPVPDSPGPGPLNEAIAFAPAAFEALDGKSPGLALLESDDHLEAMFVALTRAASGFESLFGAGFADSLDPVELRNLMRTLGRSAKVADPPCGTLALLDGHWIVVLAASGGRIRSALGLTFTDFEPRFRVEELRDMPSAKCEAMWLATSERALRDDVAIGQFWGPVMSRYRRLLTRRPGLILDLLETVFPSARHDTSSYAALVASIAPELWPVTDSLPLWPGTVLLTDTDDELGVALADGSVLGIKASDLENFAQVMPAARFKPKYAWYPHL